MTTMMIRTTCPGFALNADSANCTSQQHRLRLLSNTSSSFKDVQGLQVATTLHGAESHRPVNVRSRSPGFSIKDDTRFRSASFTGQYAISALFCIISTFLPDVSKTFKSPSTAVRQSRTV